MLSGIRAPDSTAWKASFPFSLFRSPENSAYQFFPFQDNIDCMAWHDQNPSNYCWPKAMLSGIRAPDSTAWKASFPFSLFRSPENSAYQFFPFQDNIDCMAWHDQNPSNYCWPKAMLPGIRAPDSTAWKLFKPRRRKKIKGFFFLLPFYLPMFVAGQQTSAANRGLQQQTRKAIDDKYQGYIFLFFLSRTLSLLLHFSNRGMSNI